MKTKRLVCILAVSVAMFAGALALTSCQGLTFAANPDGSISGNYRPPVVTPAK